MQKENKLTKIKEKLINIYFEFKYNKEKNNRDIFREHICIIIENAKNAEAQIVCNFDLFSDDSLKKYCENHIYRIRELKTNSNKIYYESDKEYCKSITNNNENFKLKYQLLNNSNNQVLLNIKKFIETSNKILDEIETSNKIYYEIETIKNPNDEIKKILIKITFEIITKMNLENLSKILDPKNKVEINYNKGKAKQKTL